MPLPLTCVAIMFFGRYCDQGGLVKASSQLPQQCVSTGDRIVILHTATISIRARLLPLRHLECLQCRGDFIYFIEAEANSTVLEGGMGGLGERVCATLTSEKSRDQCIDGLQLFPTAFPSPAWHHFQYNARWDFGLGEHVSSGMWAIN
jgi:hypothetical protein